MSFVVHELATMIFGDSSSVNAYKRSISYGLIGLGIIAGASAGYVGYRWHVVNRERDAQKAFAESLQLYRTAFEKPELWSEVALAFEQGRMQHASSLLAPYFRAYQADALSYQNKTEEALTAVQDAVASLSTSSPLYYLYATKQALMKMDSAQKELAQAGLQELEALSQNSSNKQRDMALYYLGAYHQAHNNAAQARQVWQDLVTGFASQAEASSPWAALAQEQLA